VVTGDDGRGKAVFVSDEQVTPVRVEYFPATAFHRLWGSDLPATVPNPGTPPATADYFPPEGGYRFGLVTFPPAGAARDPDLDVDSALAEVERELPGLMAHRESDAGKNAGMHTTESVDCEVVLSGEITLELDDGEVRTLRPFDTVVQNGTRHRWRNLTSEPGVMAVFMLGAQPSGEADSRGRY
jgi:quercetin dioxygenase-like cupin family protein